MTMGLRSMFTELQRSSSHADTEPNPVSPPAIQPIIEDTSEDALATTELAKTTQHIMKYPVAKSTIETVQSVDYPRLVSPYMVELRKSAPIKPVFESVDNFNDAVLDQVDRYVPQLQQVEPHDIIEIASAPFVSARETTARLTQATEDIINKRVVAPARKVVADFRERYSNILIDNNGRAILRGRADPIVKPINVSLEKFIDEHLAEGDSVPSEGFSNELSRSTRIIVNGVQRARPVIRSVPRATTNHVLQVYQENKEKDGETYLGTLRATMQTGSQITWEGIESILSLLNLRRAGSVTTEA